MTKHVFEVDDTTEEERRTYITFDIAGQMVRGAIIAGFVFFGPVVFVYALYLLGTWLPPESKEAQDPTHDSFVSSSENL